MLTPPNAKRQQGAVLLISLLVLLVLTLIGLSSLDSSVMEEKMATNAQTSNATFQAAETAIRETFYVENQNPTAAVKHAIVGYTTPARTTNGITRSSQLVAPPNGRLPATCNSSGDQQLIEIVGIANTGDIRRRNVQGYTVCPLPPS
jgi:Tfp pilus assembly protein PilX